MQPGIVQKVVSDRWDFSEIFIKHLFTPVRQKKVILFLIEMYTQKSF